MHPYGEKKPGGLPRIIFGWARALMSADKKNEYIIFFKKTPEKKPELPGKWKIEVLGEGRFWLDRLSKKESCDIYIFNTPVLPFFWKPKRSLTITLDYPYKYLSAKNWRERFFRIFLGWYHGRSMKRSSHILAVSNSTKQDTKKFFGIPEEKISVIYHGYTDICKVSETSLDLPDNFFFFAGTIKERKNVFNIIRAFEVFIRKDSDYKFVVGGKNEGVYYEKILNYTKSKKIEDKIIFLGHLNESELSFVYKKAKALIFPSIVEGTGFPILEAMSCGLPVITSNIFGPAELGANGGAVLVDPYDPEAIFEAMKKIAYDKEYVRVLKEKGIEQASRFSWINTGKETLDLIEKICKK